MKSRRKNTAMELAHRMRHRDSSDESPAMKTGAAAAPPQFVQRIAVRRIVCDDRERRSGVPEALANHPDVEVTTHRLSLGDYRVDDTLIVERKTLADFAKSVKDGRLFSQAARLSRQRTKRVCLIIEGTSTQYPNLAIPLAPLRGALVTVAVIFCLPILRSVTPEETAKIILYAARQLQHRNTKPARRYGYNLSSLAHQQRFLLQAIPEIGPLKAGRLLNAFGSPAGVANATAKDLEVVEGIGPSAAEKVHRVFHES